MPKMLRNFKDAFISSKVERILKEGVRRNTRKPVSKNNPRRKVSQKQASAIANSMYERGNRKA